MVTEWNFLSNSLKIFSNRTAGPILKKITQEYTFCDPFSKIVCEINICL